MEERDLDIEQFERGAESETGCSIDINAVKEQATWYSVLNTTSLTMGSGMGIALSDDESNELLWEAGVSRDQPPMKGVCPLKALFKSGDPGLVRGFSARDFSTWRWNPDSFDKTLAPQPQGWTILQEIECAKWFSIPVGAEAIDEALRNEWRINALLLSGMASRQCDFAFDNLRNRQGLFFSATNEPANLEDQACLLWACSDLGNLLDNRDRFPLFANPDVAKRFMSMADDLFLVIADYKDSLIPASPNPILAQALAVRAMTWYAANTEAQDLRARSLWLLREFADNLVRAQDKSEMVGDTLVDAAASLTALVDAFRVTRLKTYAEAATKIFDFIESQWGELSGTYSPTPLANEYTYNADDIGIILGSLNAGRLFLGDRINRDLAELRLRVFFCEAVNLSGLQMSMPGIEFLPDWLQQREPSAHFRYGSIPLPSELNIAPVLAAEVSYDPHSDAWARRGLFDTPAAMHACCEFLWIDHEAVNGFPEILLDQSPLAVRKAAGVE